MHCLKFILVLLVPVFVLAQTSGPDEPETGGGSSDDVCSGFNGDPVMCALVVECYGVDCYEVCQYNDDECYYEPPSIRDPDEGGDTDEPDEGGDTDVPRGEPDEGGERGGDDGPSGPNCGIISDSNLLTCCVIESNHDKCWRFMCGSIDNTNYGMCCTGADVLSGGCPGHCNSITASNNAVCCSGSNPASGCLSYTCRTITQSNYGACCAGAQTATGCAASCSGASPPSGCPPAGCVTISLDNFGSCCSSSPASGCKSYECGTAGNIAPGNYSTCCGSGGKGAGCDGYCESINYAGLCPANPCASVNGNNYGACCSESSTACSTYCANNKSSDVCKTSGSSVMSAHMTGLLLLICFLLAAF